MAAARGTGALQILLSGYIPGIDRIWVDTSALGAGGGKQGDGNDE